MRAWGVGMVVMVVAVVFALSGVVSAACDGAAGKRVYEKSCATCHGKEGKGIMPKMPDFSKGDRMNKADKELLVSIDEGVKGTVMPAWKGKLADADMVNVLCYIRNLGPQKIAPVVATEKKKEEVKKEQPKKKEAAKKADPCSDKKVSKAPAKK